MSRSRANCLNCPQLRLNVNVCSGSTFRIFLYPDVHEKAKEVTSQVCKLPAFEHARRISIYLSMPKGEISTTDIVKQALEQGKKVFVPHIQKSQESTSSEKTMEMLALSSLEDLESLEHDSWGIPKLSKASVPERQNALGGFGRSKDTSSEEADHAAGLDLILLPGMAFDSSNGRLGHGKGFYDHFLQKYWEMASRRSIPPKMPFLGTVCP